MNRPNKHIGMIKRLFVFLMLMLLCASCGTVYENYTAKTDDEFVVADLLFDEDAIHRLYQEMRIL